jgi:hypothetical protein
MAKATVGLLARVVSPTLASTPKPSTHDLVRLAPSQCRHFHRAPPRQEEKLSFRGQLYESTAQRLARERAEEGRFAATRSAQGNSTLRLFATTFCMRDPQLLPEFDEEGREALTVELSYLQSSSAPQALATTSARLRPKNSPQLPLHRSMQPGHRSTIRGTR